MGTGVADPGKDIVGKLKFTLIYATNGHGQEGATMLQGATREYVINETKLDYEKYYVLGDNEAAVYRSYEEWLQPIKGSQAVMLSYEPKSVTEKGIKFDLNFWQGKKKTFSTVNDAAYGEKIIIIGSPWKEGKLLYILDLKK